ncbi:aspartate kinase [Pyxidicoccus fallax]|uniref:Aspartokinase n=1 Tax=Pyxidicoccus fallax TaxID=394095 RepID=A0A848LZT8_9BACT|nr:aspartate kinase [Pyxidicoccus fallax]NMO22833.1 aspartate kinase [Pyxidicoccus fallax]NPC79938.1 aspartate kinase [Pyxidicoccus fallax]
MKPTVMRPPPGGGAFQEPRRPLLVKKFGGTSVASIERIRKVARLAVESQRAGNDVVVVVSAMAGETDRLLKLAHQVLPLPDSRELDVLASTGEQVSVALTALAIQAEGGQAFSLLGYQLPVVTDSAFTRARIQWVEKSPIRKALHRGQIAVVAGFQGVDPENNITTLGRGGSDTTAVAVAAALKADVCEIYTDVDGVYTADPRVCPSGRKLRAVPYEEMLELASLGAKVLQVRSVEIAMKYEVPIHVRSSFSEEEGTWILPRDQVLEARRLAGLACERGQARVELLGVECSPEQMTEVTDLLAEQNVSVDMLCHARCAPGSTRADIAFTLPEGDLLRTRQSLEQLSDRLGARELRVSNSLTKVSLVGIGLRSDPGIAARLCRNLSQQGIPVSGLVVNELRISCLLDAGLADRAVRILHDTFELAGEVPAEPLTSSAPA